MKTYGVYLTIDGGEETQLYKAFETENQALKEMDILSHDRNKIKLLAPNKSVTCLEVLDRRNMTTIDYIPMI